MDDKTHGLAQRDHAAPSVLVARLPGNCFDEEIVDDCPQNGTGSVDGLEKLVGLRHGLGRIVVDAELVQTRREKHPGVQ